MQTSKIKDVTAFLESLAPRILQESYDNSGLLTGNQDALVSGVLVTLDCTEGVVEEAIALKCNRGLPILHSPGHPDCQSAGHYYHKIPGESLVRAILEKR